MSAAPPPDLHRLFNKVCRGAWDCWVRRGRERRVRGHTMFLPHLHRIFTVFSTRFVVGPGIVGSGGAGKGECEDTRCVCRTSTGSSPSFQQGLSWGLGLLGQVGPGKESARTHDVSAAPPPDLHRLFNKVCRGAWDCWVRRGRERTVRGHTMFLPYLHRIFTVFSTRFVGGPGIVGSGWAGKGECEDTRCFCRTSTGSSPSFQQGLSWGLGLLGQAGPGKESARTHDVSAVLPPDLHRLCNKVCRGAWDCWVRRGRERRVRRHMMFLPYLHRIFTVFSTRFVVGPGIVGSGGAGKGECEDTRCFCRTSTGSSPSFQQGLSWGLGLLGQAGPGKESARTHDVSAVPPPDLHRLFNKVCRGAWDSWVRRGQERRVRGHMMCLPHLHRIFTVFSTRFVVGPGIVGSGGARKGECEDT